MVGGVLFNFLLALFIYSMVLFAWGDTYLPLKNVKLGMDYSETFLNVGFRDGDILLRADGEELERYDEHCLRQVVEAQQVTVLRDGVETTIPMPDDMMKRMGISDDELEKINEEMMQAFGGAENAFGAARTDVPPRFSAGGSRARQNAPGAFRHFFSRASHFFLKKTSAFRSLSKKTP